MSNYKNKTAITQKYHIEVPLHEYYSGACVYKVWFAKNFYIGKGKALMQSVQNMANTIERALRTRNYDKSDLYYKVITYINKNSVLKGFVEIIGGEGLSNFELLKLEQETLNKFKNNKNCLNNNLDAYVPQWMPEIDVQKYLQWKGISESKLVKRSQSKKKTELFKIFYFKDSDKTKRGVYKLMFGDYYYIGRAKLLHNRVLFHNREIKMRLCGEKELVENDMYKKIIDVIIKNDFKVATCVLLKECDTIEELMQFEQSEMDKSKNDKHCLNVGFVSKRYANEKEYPVSQAIKPVVITRGGKKIFFKPYQKKNKDARA